MRNTLKFSIATLTLAAGVSACSDARATSASQADLKRDLELASSTVSLAAPKVDSTLLTLESQPKGTPMTAMVVKKAPGPKAVRSKTPTVLAAPTEESAAVEETEAITETLAEAPVPAETPEPVAVAPRPQPVVINTGGSGDYGEGNGGVYGGGGGRGVIIRGGGVDGDNCQIHAGGRGTRGPIFVPSVPRSTGTIVNRPSGIGIGSRSPGAVSRGVQSVSRPSASPGRTSIGGGPRGGFGARGR